MKISVAHKTGFFNKSGRDFVIKDERGVIFYTNKFLVNKLNYFNLPKGEYTTEASGTKSNFVKLSKPVHFKKIKLPPPVRNLDISKFKIIWKTNPRKGTINWNNQTITIDPHFVGASKPVKLYMIGHELGHRYYGDSMKSIIHEKNADAYAYNLCISWGLNPSQIFLAQFTTIEHNAAIERKRYLLNKIKKLKA
jgi:hypothetical protein